MKRWISFLFILLLGWNILLSVQLYRVSVSEHEKEESARAKEEGVRKESIDIASDVSELVAKSENKVVTVVATLREESVSTGSGAIYKIKDKIAYIITNNHVIADGNGARVSFANGREVRADIVGCDELTDLALLKAEVDASIEAFTPGDSSLVKKGEYVIAMGSPLGIEYQGSVSGGLISGINRRMEMDIDDNGIADWDMNVLQTDAAINPGNSGGPLINMAGELIGINSMKIAETTVEGFGFAIPINEVLPIISQLESDGKVIRPILGISVQPLSMLTPFEQAYLGISSQQEEGLFVVNVAHRSPADKAGMEVGDILLKMDGEVLKDFKQFRQILYSHQVGESVTVEYQHNGKLVTKKIILE